jgi:hypothetical protein
MATATPTDTNPVDEMASAGVAKTPLTVEQTDTLQEPFEVAGGGAAGDGAAGGGGGAAAASARGKTAKKSAVTSVGTARGKTVRKEKEEKGLKGVPKQPLTVEEWAAAKAKYPELFTYTSTGDLKSPATKPAEQDKIIVLPHYVKTTLQEIQEYFTRRLESLKEPEETYAAAKRALNQLMLVRKQNPADVPIYQVLIANQKVHDAECIVNAMAKSPRNFISEEGVQSQLLTHDWYDRGVNPERVGIGQYTTFPEEAFWRAAAAGESFNEMGVPAPAAPTAPVEAKPKRQLSGAQIAMINKARSQRPGGGGGSGGGGY